ncbi:single-stranded-DNA-specific exonuclease RecJ [candidate division WS6 bacterium RIFOXYB1_FULL_33_14]|uniref:Single-stranded-DNA-specific exonuclease RecJ n=1 Tax=candidate division WS6 bacterium RIFOXYB1_FULL_33_14 TaxID=1817896 RepID=A0A1F4UH69_9BACT|nr:MAG: single-stranded-DNA-specific exonuclease RecJ [candidate division WS6 bacterium RIFOXYB1_FULL_33_14]
MTLKSNSNWILPKEKISENISEYILKSRGIDRKEFLNSTLKDIPSFKKLFDTKKAAKEIVKAVKGGKKIVIHGDFDADGICSVSILWKFLFKEVSEKLNTKVEVVPYIPSRVDQGYGLTESSVNDVLQLGGQLLISVDCGVRDSELIKRFKEEKDLDFVITDHHQPPSDLGTDLEYPLVHPMYPSHEYPNTNVCGAFVTFLLIQAIKSELGMDIEVNENTKGLDLVAMATVTDLMPLQGINRVVVRYGIEQIKRGSRVGLNELIKVSGIEQKDIDSYHLGYILGPRINAAGRIGSPLDAVKLLVSDKEEVCKNIAEILNETNFQRQHMTQSGLDEAMEIVGDSDSKLLFVVGNDWHEGIVGLIAGKLNEKYHRPILVATRGEEGIRGSARSIEGFNITNALSKCDKYLERYGGHDLAAGFTIKSGKEKEFSECIHKIAGKLITDEMLVRNLNIDLLLSSESISKSLVYELDILKPFGYGNSKPLIGMTELIVFKKQIMGKLGNHMKLICKGDGIDLITLVMFNCEQDTQEISVDDKIDVIGGVGINSWNGNEDIQFLVKEWRYST